MRRSPGLADRLTALREAVEAADGRLPAEQLQPARTLLAKAGARTALGESTVVALAGATGSGKSSLFNALSGAEVSTPGVRRPTTGTAHASTWGSGEVDPLLDWLQVPRRHRVPDPDPALDGLVLLDLPDHDSTRVENRLEVDRLVELVDVLVWVLDPQKYADAAVHDRYLRPYAGHAGVLLVVLNQADRLEPAALAACRADLRRLLDAEGLERVDVVATSARTGEGLPELRALLARRVSARRAATERLAADARAVAAPLATGCSEGAGTVSKADRAALVSALSDAAGVPQVTAAVDRSVRAQSKAATGWPALRWTGRLRADPLRRLHLTGAADGGGGRSSLSGPSGVQRARVTSAVRQVREASALPDGWRDSLREDLDDREARLADRLDAAVSGTDLGADRRPRWWSAVGALQWLLLATALVGALWLLALVGLAYLQLDEVVPVPRLEGLPLPTLLLVGGLLGGLLLAVVVRPFHGMTARRRARRAASRLRQQVEHVAEQEVLAPVEAQREAFTRFCTAVGRAAA